MEINRYIKEAHDYFVSVGEYDCPECLDEYGEPTGCTSCNKTGIAPNKDIGELLMLIVSELGEALEAHRKGRFAKLGEFVQFVGKVDFNILMNGFENYLPGAISYFEKYIKDTFEDEIADVFIRLFDLCGYLSTQPNEVRGLVNWKSKNIGDQLRQISKKVLEIDSEYVHKTDIGFVVLYLNDFCRIHNIPIEKHIEAKMAYVGGKSDK